MIKKATLLFMALIGVFATVLCQPGANALLAESTSPGRDLDLIELGRAIEESIVAEKASVENFSEQLKILDHERIYYAAALNGYQLRVSTYESLLLTSGVSVSAVRKAQTELQASINEVQKMIDEIQPRANAITMAKKNIGQQKNLNKKQLSELQKISRPANVVSKLKLRARELSGLLARKESLIARLDRTITSRVDQLEELKHSFSALADKFEGAVEELKKQHFFERRKGLFSAITIAGLKAEWAGVQNEIGASLKAENWQTDVQRFWRSSGNVLIAFLVILVVLTVILKRAVRGVARLETHARLQELGPCHQIAVQVFKSLFVLSGISVILYVYSHIDVLYLSTAALKLAAYILFVLIGARFLRLLIKAWPCRPHITAETLTSLKRLITFTQYFCWLHLVGNWGLKSDSILLLLLRIFFETGLLVWTFKFWRGRPIAATFEPADNLHQQSLLIAIKTISYLIGGIALLLDLIGYGTLAILWLTSWGRSLIVILCWTGFYMMLQEWDQYYRQKRTSERDELLHDEYPLQWLMIRAGQLGCAISLVVVLILAWGGQQAVLVKIYAWLGYQLKIGNMSFSALGVIYSILALLATHAVARLWRWIFQTKFLNRSGMAVGLQDSITTITVYAIWILGVTVALHVFGLNTATLAVALGALGVGLGFGLQNIFNNFISGIILLFERPIQVGDDVEINGTWATVKKINVRSTVVQSYDNASLIIPNSEFISSQVTNWSFKDKRLRRKISVGVAYGSDVDRVKETLLEIAGSTPRVLKRPEPDVLFTDFGDSALIFILRIWTDIDHMLRVETAIRFEIDRLFKERGIEIAFPQRDIHIRSTVAGNLDPGTLVEP